MTPPCHVKISSSVRFRSAVNRCSLLSIHFIINAVEKKQTYFITEALKKNNQSHCNSYRRELITNRSIFECDTFIMHQGIEITICQKKISYPFGATIKDCSVCRGKRIHHSRIGPMYNTESNTTGCMYHHPGKI
jgi:hypothetical protein